MGDPTPRYFSADVEATHLMVQRPRQKILSVTEVFHPAEFLFVIAHANNFLSNFRARTISDAIVRGMVPHSAVARLNRIVH